MVNPYLNEFLTVWNPVDKIDRVASIVQEFSARDRMLIQYGFAIPNDESIDILREYSPIIEVGAGRGYWAFMASQSGADILAFDNKIRSDLWIPYCGNKTPVSTYFPIKFGNTNTAKRYSSRTLLLIWPPYGTSMAYDCLKSHHEAGGTRIIYVGEGHGGCTGDDLFHEYLESFYNEVRVVNLPNWTGIRDYLSVWELKDSISEVEIGK